MRWPPLLLLCLIVLTLVGCGKRPGLPPLSGTPRVEAAPPVKDKVVDWEPFVGRTDAVDSVDVKARVGGQLVSIHFKQGDIVKGDAVENTSAKVIGLLGAAASHMLPTVLPSAASLYTAHGQGDLLFVIDPRTYLAQYDESRAKLDANEAQLRVSQSILDRGLRIAQQQPGAISQEDLDQYRANRDQAAANKAGAKAQLDLAALNLSFTRVTAPISGKISRPYVTVGNIVTQEQTLLTTIVSEDPIYAYFDVDDRIMLQVQEAMRSGRITLEDRKKAVVDLGLPNEKGWPHRGWVDFANNKVDPQTGTLSVRGVFPNPKPELGPRFLTPGQFVRIRLPISPPVESLLVAETAFSLDQGQRILYVLDSDNVVQYRRVTVGALQDNGLRVVRSGLQEHERVVLTGLQVVKPKMKVEVEEVKMPVNPVPGDEAK
jgi:multidrug efflux system membrane fusion protein